MAKTYEEKFNYECNKIRGDRNAQNVFFGKAIAIQNSPDTVNIDYANNKFEFACDVLVHMGYCNNTMCDDCKLAFANASAQEEIMSGKRRRVIVKHFYVTSEEDVETGIVTETRVPVEPKIKYKTKYKTKAEFEARHE